MTRCRSLTSIFLISLPTHFLVRVSVFVLCVRLSLFSSWSKTTPLFGICSYLFFCSGVWRHFPSLLLSFSCLVPLWLCWPAFFLMFMKQLCYLGLMSPLHNCHHFYCIGRTVTIGKRWYRCCDVHFFSFVPVSLSCCVSPPALQVCPWVSLLHTVQHWWSKIWCTVCFNSLSFYIRSMWSIHLNLLDRIRIHVIK